MTTLEESWFPLCASVPFGCCVKASTGGALRDLMGIEPQERTAVHIYVDGSPDRRYDIPATWALAAFYVGDAMHHELVGSCGGILCGDPDCILYLGATDLEKSMAPEILAQLMHSSMIVLDPLIRVSSLRSSI